MAQKAVKGYFVGHKIGGKTRLTLHFEGGGTELIDNIEVSEAAYLIDLLRNEKPLVYDTTTKFISTSTQEPVGEGE
jgi:hypothetical protein